MRGKGALATAQLAVEAAGAAKGSSSMGPMLKWILSGYMLAQERPVKFPVVVRMGAG